MEVRVRLVETDALGVVYYSQYFSYFDLSRLEMLRKAGISPGFLKRKNLGFVAAEASCRYLASAKFDDVLTLNVRVDRVGSSSVTYAHQVNRGREEIADGKVTDVLVELGGRPIRMPEELKSILERCR